MSDYPLVRIKTNYGSMVAQMLPDKAPKTVANFLAYVQRGFYAGTLFHRVIKGFMIQGGGLKAGMYSKATNEPIPNEAINGLQNKRFTLAMARTPDPHSATSQFFINMADNHFLDYTAPTEDGFGYCVFGRLLEGLDVAMAISELATESRAGYKDVPVQNVTIETIEEIVEGDGV